MHMYIAVTTITVLFFHFQCPIQMEVLESRRVCMNMNKYYIECM